MAVYLPVGLVTAYKAKAQHLTTFSRQQMVIFHIVVELYIS